jgi:hypothetical protein
MRARAPLAMVALAAVAIIALPGCGSSDTPSPSTTASVAALSVADVDPLLGPMAGGTTLTITGQGFTGDTQVTIGTVAAIDIVVVSDTTITAVTPPGPAGPVDVIVAAGAQAPSTWDGVFTYVGQAPAPTITRATGIAGGVLVEFTDNSTIVDAVENYEYSVDGGSTWTAFDPPQAKVPSVTIDGLTAGTSYDVALRAVNIAGPGASSNTAVAAAR